MSDDRRRFFRIDDSIGVAYEVIDENDLVSQPNAPRQVDVFSLLNDLDKTITQELGELRLRDPKLAVLMDAFDRKLSAIVNQLEIDNELVQRLAYKVKEVNISACGMGLEVGEDLAKGTLLMIDLVLLPGNVNIFTYGRVVDAKTRVTEESDDEDEAGFYVRLDFFGMSATDQELLIQHIVKRQGHLLRAAWE
jgi:c-di-GMP-binding flagellar brake protein YcgR